MPLTLLSLLEDAGLASCILQCLSHRDGLQLRLACTVAARAVAQQPWDPAAAAVEWLLADRDSRYDDLVTARARFLRWHELCSLRDLGFLCHVRCAAHCAGYARCFPQARTLVVEDAVARTRSGGYLGAHAQPQLPQLDTVGDDTLRAMTHLRMAVLLNCDGVTDDGVAHLRSARTVALLQCAWLTSGCFAHLAGAERVYFYCPRALDVADAHLVHLARARVVRVGAGVTDAGVAHLACVRELELLRPGRIDGSGFAGCRRLARLRLVSGPRSRVGSEAPSLLSVPLVPPADGAQQGDGSSSSSSSPRLVLDAPFFSHLAGLVELTLDHCDAGADQPPLAVGVTALRPLTALVALSVRRADVRDAHFSVAGSAGDTRQPPLLPCLRALHMQRCHEFVCGDDGVSAGASSSTAASTSSSSSLAASLQELCVDRCAGFTGTGLARLRALQRVRVSNCPAFTAGALAA